MVAVNPLRLSFLLALLSCLQLDHVQGQTSFNLDSSYFGNETSTADDEAEAPTLAPAIAPTLAPTTVVEEQEAPFAPTLAPTVATTLSPTGTTAEEPAVEEQEVPPTTANANATYVIRPDENCLAYASYCIPVDTFRHLPEFSQDPSTLDESGKQIIRYTYLDLMRRMHMQMTGLDVAIADALVDRYNEFKDANFMVVTIEGSAVDVAMYSLGVTISDLGQIDYLKGQFVVDMRIYIHKVTAGAPHYNLQSAINAIWTKQNETTITKPDKEENEGHIHLLPDEYLYVKEDVDEDDVLLTDGRCNDVAFDSMQLLSMEEYSAMSGGIHVAETASMAKLNPVTDKNNNVVFLEAKGLAIKFQPINRDFFPFQVNLLDVQVFTPPVGVWNKVDPDLFTFCVNSAFTGFDDPLPSLPDSGRLTLIPHVKVMHSAPWFNVGNPQMQLTDTAGSSVAIEDIAEKAYQAANFRIVYRNEAGGYGWMVLLPFLFTAFTTQLQWMVTTPESCSGSSMITSVLLIQNIVGGQKEYTGYNSIASDVIYMTYVVTGIYVSAVALMTFINITKGTGTIEFLARHQKKIFKYMQLVGLLMTPLYIPILVFSTDWQTGEQDRYPWLWPLTAMFCVLVLVFKIVRDCFINSEKLREKEAAKVKDILVDFQRIDLSKKAVTSLTVDEVKEWVSKSKELQQATPFTEEELSSIAHRFHDARIDGNALVRVASDPKILVQFVGLSIGEALNFSDAFEKLKQGRNIMMEEGEIPVGIDIPTPLPEMNKSSKSRNSMRNNSSRRSRRSRKKENDQDIPDLTAMMNTTILDVSELLEEEYDDDDADAEQPITKENNWKDE